VASSWTATIDWGDGSTPIVNNAAKPDVGTIIKNADGTFSVLGSHSYPAAANFPITVTITGDKGAKTVETGTATARNIITLVGSELIVNGSSGNDTFSITRQSDGKIHVNLNGSDRKVTASSVSHLSLTGFAGDDSVGVAATGVPGIYVQAGDGNDVVSGGSGNDNLVGGAGKNTLFGGDGDDRVVGSGGRDNLDGGPGNDRVYGGAGNDVMHGGLGVDRLYGGDGDDLLLGDQSNDKLYGEGGNDQLFGGKGTDLLDGGPGDDTAFVDAGESPTNVEHVA
jgi:Ca2+-binding RTX toxin-like protein